MTGHKQHLNQIFEKHGFLSKLYNVLFLLLQTKSVYVSKTIVLQKIAIVSAQMQKTRIQLLHLELKHHDRKLQQQNQIVYVPVGKLFTIYILMNAVANALFIDKITNRITQNYN